MPLDFKELEGPIRFVLFLIFCNLSYILLYTKKRLLNRCNIQPNTYAKF